MKTAIRQHDPSDCAAACIAAIARHYGEAVPLTFIRETSGTSQAGTSIKGILDACREIGFQAAGYKSDEKNIEGLYGLAEPASIRAYSLNDRCFIQSNRECRSGPGRLSRLFFRPGSGFMVTR